MVVRCWLASSIPFSTNMLHSGHPRHGYKTQHRIELGNNCQHPFHSHHQLFHSLFILQIISNSRMRKTRKCYFYNIILSFSLILILIFVIYPVCLTGQKPTPASEREPFKCPEGYGNGNFADPATCRKFYQVGFGYTYIPYHHPLHFYIIITPLSCAVCVGELLLLLLFFFPLHFHFIFFLRARSKFGSFTIVHVETTSICVSNAIISYVIIIHFTVRAIQYIYKYFHNVSPKMPILLVHWPLKQNCIIIVSRWALALKCGPKKKRYHDAPNK